jgi:glutamate synthase domain-containing protein 2
MFPVDLLQLHPAVYCAFTLSLIAGHDLLQKDHAILRNFPILGHARYAIEMLGPELRQYLYMGDREEKPFDRVTRSYIYATAKAQNNKIGFGTQRDYTALGEVHFLHSMFPVPEKRMPKTFTPLVIGPKRRNPYFCTARIGIADMSFGALSQEAIQALRKGATLAGIHMCTGEGGLTDYHLDEDGLVMAEIGPGKFGYRTLDGQLDMDKVRKVAALKQVVSFHLKLSQGAKPGAGGMLPKEKITEEIARIRGIRMGEDCISPNSWDEFSDIVSLCAVLTMLQEETGKPVGIKIAVGDKRYIELLALYMQITGNGPDYIILDGGEGGTGAAPMMLADHVGMSIEHALPMVDNIFRKFGVRDDVTIISSGKVATPADIARHLAKGADLVHIARGFMLSIGCIMALKCHTNHCPTGIATQDPWLRHGLDPQRKGIRAYNYANGLAKELLILMSTMGVTETWQLRRRMFVMVTEPGVVRPLDSKHLYPYPVGRDGPRNPVTIHNLEEYRAKWDITEKVAIPTQQELDARLDVLLEKEEQITAADNLKRLVADAANLLKQVDIIQLHDDGDSPDIDLLGKIKS